MTGSGTVWRRDFPESSGHPSRSDFVLVEADPHDVLGSPTVYIKTRSVVDGKRQRTHAAITTVAALVGHYKPAPVMDWPGDSVWQPRHTAAALTSLWVASSSWRSSRSALAGGCPLAGLGRMG